MTTATPHPRSTRAGLPILTFAAMLVLLLYPARLGAQQEVSIIVVPTAVQLSADQPAQARVVLRNATTSPLRDITLSWFTNIDARVEPETERLAQLSAGSEHVWPISITTTGPRIAGSILLRADYTTQPQTPAQPATRSTFGTLEISTQLIDQVADVTVQSDLSALTEQNPGKVYLLISNKTNTPITLKNIRPRPNEYVTFEPISVTTPIVIAPYGSYATNFSVETTSVVLPGKQVLLFDLEIEQAGYTRQLVTTHPVEIGVFGDALIRTALALPSLFVLPGFLAIVTVELLWGLGKTKEQRAEFRLPANTAEFWTIAIILSLGAAVVYPHVTQWVINERRNYILGAYGLYDIVVIWLASMGLASIGYGIIRIVQKGIKRWRDKRERQAQERAQAELVARTFASTDDPLDVLHKLIKNQRSLYRQSIQLRNENRNAYLLDEEFPAQGNVWVTPPIRIDWLDKGKVPKLPELIDTEFSEPPETIRSAAIVELLQQGVEMGALHLSWMPLTNLHHPQHISVTLMQEIATPPQMILQMQ